MSEEREGLYLPPQPQVTVVEKDGAITIRVAMMSDSFDEILLKDVSFPVEIGEKVAQGILDLVKS